MFVKQIKDENIKGSFKTIMYLGSVVKISCFGKKYPTHAFKRLSWYHSGKHLSNSGHYKIDIYGTLTINGVTVTDSGEFICLMISKSGKYKFKHDIKVVQFPSRSLHIHFVYAVRLCSPKSEDVATHFIESKVKGRICLKNECKLGYINSSCYFEEFANPRIKVTVPVLLPRIPNKKCNIQCLREKQEISKEEVKQKVISAVMQGSRLKIREEPKEMSVSYLETEEDNICEPGFEMKGSSKRSLCFPCTPGHFLEKGFCIPCHLNHYTGKYAASECRTCFGNRITRSRGAISEDDCYWADPDILWILFGISMIIILFIFICCCCFFSRRKELISDETEDEKLLKEDYGNFSKSKIWHGKSQLKGKLPERKTPESTASFVIPSIRHSTGKDFLYKPLKTVAKRIISPPPPPPLPTDSALNEASRNTAHNALSSANNPKNRNMEEFGRKSIGNGAANKNTDTALKERDNTISIPLYRERIMRNKPMYNAYMKSKI